MQQCSTIQLGYSELTCFNWGFFSCSISPSQRSRSLFLGKWLLVFPQGFVLVRHLFGIDQLRTNKICVSCIFQDPTPDAPLARTSRAPSCPDFIDVVDNYTLLLHQGLIENAFLDEIENVSVAAGLWLDRAGLGIQADNTVVSLLHDSAEPSCPRRSSRAPPTEVASVLTSSLHARPILRPTALTRSRLPLPTLIRKKRSQSAPSICSVTMVLARSFVVPFLEVSLVTESGRARFACWVTPVTSFGVSWMSRSALISLTSCRVSGTQSGTCVVFELRG